MRHGKTRNIFEKIKEEGGKGKGKGKRGEERNGDYGTVRENEWSDGEGKEGRRRGVG